MSHYDWETRSCFINFLNDQLSRESSRARRFQSERDRNANELNRLQEDNFDLMTMLDDQREIQSEMIEELEAVKRQLRDSLKRKNGQQDKEILEENKRLRASINGEGRRPNADCCICMDHKELSHFTCLVPCGHMICTDVSLKH